MPLAAALCGGSTIIRAGNGSGQQEGPRHVPQTHTHTREPDTSPKHTPNVAGFGAADRMPNVINAPRTGPKPLRAAYKMARVLDPVA